MNFIMYLRLFRKWFWLIGLAVVVSGGSAYYVAHSQPPFYEAVTTLQVGTFQQNPNPSIQSISLASDLANTYFVLAKTRPFLESVVKRANISMTPDDLESAFTMNVLQNTPFFSVRVIDHNPQTAADIANAIGAEFVAQTAAIIQNKSTQIANLQVQVDSLTKELASEQQELDTIREYRQQSDSSDPVLVARENELVTRIDQQQATLAAFQGSLISLQGQGITNVLSVTEPALVPTRPISSTFARDALVAGGIGGALSIIVISLLEQLNTAIRFSPEIPVLLGLPVLGLIPSYGRTKTYRKRLITWLTPSSKAAEAFRVLRGNLIYLEKNKLKNNWQVYIVASSRTGEGKSIIAANMAVAFTTIGLRVALIDADLRQPAQHLIFGLSNAHGLSDILTYAPSHDDEKQPVFEGDPTTDQSFFSTYRNTDERQLLAVRPSAPSLFFSIPSTLPIQKTEIPRLHVITSGISQKNPADLVESHKMREVVDLLTQKEGFDIVIIDTPSVLEVADSLAIAGVVEAPVILVAEADRTSRNDAATAVQRFSVLSLPILGVILNRAKDSPVREHAVQRDNRAAVLALYNGPNGQTPEAVEEPLRVEDVPTDVDE